MRRALLGLEAVYQEVLGTPRLSTNAPSSSYLGLEHFSGSGSELVVLTDVGFPTASIILSTSFVEDD